MLTYFGFMLQTKSRRRKDRTQLDPHGHLFGRLPLLPEFARDGKLVELAPKMRHHSGKKAAAKVRFVGGEHGCTVL